MVCPFILLLCNFFTTFECWNSPLAASFSHRIPQRPKHFDCHGQLVDLERIQGSLAPLTKSVDLSGLGSSDSSASAPTESSSAIFDSTGRLSFSVSGLDMAHMRDGDADLSCQRLLRHPAGLTVPPYALAYFEILAIITAHTTQSDLNRMGIFLQV